MATNVPQTAKMQALLREVNENIRSVNDTYGPPATIQLLCECGNGCSALVTMTPEQYEQLRGNPTHFLIDPSHHNPEVDLVVADHDGWLTVEAVGIAAEIVRRRGGNHSPSA